MENKIRNLITVALNSLDNDDKAGALWRLVDAAGMLSMEIDHLRPIGSMGNPTGLGYSISPKSINLENRFGNPA